MLKNIRKNLLVGMVALTAIFGMNLNTVKANSIQIEINGKQIQSDVAPAMYKNRTMVPVRVISENLNCQVEWANTDRAVYVFSKDNGQLNKVLMLQINDNAVYNVNLPYGRGIYQALLQGKLNRVDTNVVKQKSTRSQIDVEPIIYKSRTFVPLRAISESLGVEVAWNQQLGKVEIYNPKEEQNYLILGTDLEDNGVFDMLNANKNTNTNNNDNGAIEQVVFKMIEQPKPVQQPVQQKPVQQQKPAAVRNDNQDKYAGKPARFDETDAVIKNMGYAKNTLLFKGKTYNLTSMGGWTTGKSYQRVIDGHKAAMLGSYVAGQKKSNYIAGHAHTIFKEFATNCKPGDTFIMTDGNGNSVKYKIEIDEKMDKNKRYAEPDKSLADYYYDSQRDEDVVCIQTCYYPSCRWMHGFIARPVNW